MSKIKFLYQKVNWMIRTREKSNMDFDEFGIFRFSLRKSSIVSNTENVTKL